MFINKTLRLNNLTTRRAMNMKVSVVDTCIEAIIYLLLHNLHDCTFKSKFLFLLQEKEEKEAGTHFVLLSQSRNMTEDSWKLICINQLTFYNFFQVVQVTLKYFSIFNNKPPVSWVAHSTRKFLECSSSSPTDPWCNMLHLYLDGKNMRRKCRMNTLLTSI